MMPSIYSLESWAKECAKISLKIKGSLAVSMQTVRPRSTTDATQARTHTTHTPPAHPGTPPAHPGTPRHSNTRAVGQWPVVSHAEGREDKLASSSGRDVGETN